MTVLGSMLNVWEIRIDRLIACLYLLMHFFCLITKNQLRLFCAIELLSSDSCMYVVVWCYIGEWSKRKNKHFVMISNCFLLICYSLPLSLSHQNIFLYNFQLVLVVWLCVTIRFFFFFLFIFFKSMHVLFYLSTNNTQLMNERTQNNKNMYCINTTHPSI